MTKTKKPAAKKALKAVPPIKRSKGKAPVALAPTEPTAPEASKKSGPKAKGIRKPTEGKVRDPRLPKAGTVLRKEWRGKEYEITVLAEGFEYGGKAFRSLSKIANEITGTTWNGFLWVGLVQRPKPEPRAAAAGPAAEVTEAKEAQP